MLFSLAYHSFITTRLCSCVSLHVAQHFRRSRGKGYPVGRARVWATSFQVFEVSVSQTLCLFCSIKFLPNSRISEATGVRDDCAPSTSDTEVWSEVWRTLEGMFESILNKWCGRREGSLGLLKLQSYWLVCCWLSFFRILWLFVGQVSISPRSIVGKPGAHC